MARQYATGTIYASLIAGLNETHRAVVALETSKPHDDGPEFDVDGVEQVLSSFFGSAPTNLGDSINVMEKSIVLFDSHVGRHNSGSGKRIYAHKSAGTAIAGTVGSAGAVLEQAMVDAWGPRCLELLTSLRAHLLNTGGTWHTTTDTFNSLGTLPTAITTKADLCTWTIVAYNVYMAHIGYGSGVVHSSADSTNVLTVAPPDNADDWDGVLGVLVELAAELEDHVEDASFHANAMSVTYTVAAFPAAVTTAFTRANAYRSAHGTHLADTGIHNSADSTNTISASAATTVATYVALAAEVYTDLTAHLRNAPVSQAHRLV